MACTSPLKGYRARTPNENGKYPIVFKSSEGGEHLDVPCGQCMACRLERSRQWTMRIMHETQMHEDSIFLTLTYDDANLPHDWSLNVDHFQKFMKRLRKKISPHKVRYYHCGEYGDQNGRPHYHVALFGYDFPDKELVNAGEYNLYSSSILTKLWKHGIAVYGSLTWDSASYIASYVTKKINGPLAGPHYQRFHPDIGVYWLKPEYSTMSLKPGIGATWYEKHRDDCIRLDSVSSRGRSVRLPKAYDRILEKEQPTVYQIIKDNRMRHSKPDDYEERLRDRAIILQSKHNLNKGIL